MYETDMPSHIGIIMDGNGRWAKKRGMIRTFGHKKGADNIKSLLTYVFKKGLKCLSIFAFSTENFNRPEQEVNFLMDLFVTLFKKEAIIFKREEIKVVFSGRKDNLRKDVRDAITKLEEDTSDNKNGMLNVCLNYGGRQEIVDATKKIAELVGTEKLNVEDINEDTINENLYQKLPPLDFVIRTSGEYRISNFLLWQSAYAEYYFPEVLFPDFDEAEFDKAIIEYNKRHRRFGGI